MTKQSKTINLSYDGPFCIYCQKQNPVPTELEDDGEHVNITCCHCGKDFGCGSTVGTIAPMARRALQKGIRVRVAKDNK